MYPTYQLRIENQLSKIKLSKPKIINTQNEYFIKTFLKKWDLINLYDLIVINNYFEDYNDLWFLKDSLDKDSIDYDKKLDEELNHCESSKKKLVWLLASICNNNKPEPISY